jgi:hypothetical protein
MSSKVEGPQSKTFALPHLFLEAVKASWIFCKDDIAPKDVTTLPLKVASSIKPLVIPGSLSLAPSSLVPFNKSLFTVLKRSLSFSRIWSDT